MTRTDRPTYFLDLALRCAQQGTCIRRNSGAVIVDGTPGGRSTHA
jgi:dCMP deaminase